MLAGISPAASLMSEVRNHGRRLRKRISDSNVLAHIDGFWLTFWIVALGIGFVTPITKAPPGPFTPAPLKEWTSLPRLGFPRS